ncbi:hypothetical protein ACWC4A_54145 [Streptomyces mirabilis]
MTMTSSSLAVAGMLAGALSAVGLAGLVAVLCGWQPLPGADPAEK